MRGWGVPHVKLGSANPLTKIRGNKKPPIMIFFPHKSMTHPTLQLFVGWLEVQEKDRGCMATALSIHEYVADRRVFSQTRLAVTGVKFKRKGALGSFVFNWNPRFSTMEELRTSDIGSISIT